MNIEKTTKDIYLNDQVSNQTTESDSTAVKIIHDFDFDLICEYFSLIDRQGPGSVEVTLKALSFIDNLTENSKIVDLGCGTGTQTIVLAQNTPGRVIGIDLFPRFIDIFNENIRRNHLEERVQGIVGSMGDLSF